MAARIANAAQAALRDGKRLTPMQYAYRQVVRWERGGKRPADARDVALPAWNGNVVFIPEQLTLPLRWRRPRRVFVDSMSDLYHEGLRFDQIAAVYGVMAATPHHCYQVLTKRPARIAEFSAWAERQGPRSAGDRPGWACAREAVSWLQAAYGADDGVALMGQVGFRDNLPWPLPNVLPGTSAENQETADERIPELLRAPAVGHFVSLEPLLGPIDIDPWIERIDHCNSCRAENSPQVPDRCPECGEHGTLISTWGYAQAERYRSGERYADGGPNEPDNGPQLSWVIVGGESGAGHRAMKIEWVESIFEQCRAAGVPLYVKQDSGPRPGSQGRIPDRLWVQEFPTLAGG
jgi:protein gp37